MQIGVTGGIGSGKSLVCKIFQSLGVPVYDADSRAKSLMGTDEILKSAILKEFGESSYLPDGTFNRSHIGEIVFKNSVKLRVLNALVHPRIAVDYDTWVEQYRTTRYVIKEAALLFETNSYRALDKTIVVHSQESIRIRRVLQRDSHRSEEQLREIMQKQMPEDEKLKMANFIIVNDETQLVIPQVLKLHHIFITMSQEVMKHL